MAAATQPNKVLMLDYTEGFGDPLAGSPERSRKWSPWTIAANSCGLIERSTGVAQLFLGTNNSTGKIYALTTGAYSDDGSAINSYYTTAFLSAVGLSGRNLFGYLTGYVQGSGSLAVSAFYPGNARVCFARIVGAGLAGRAGYGAVHECARRACLISIWNQFCWFMVFAYKICSLGQTGSIRFRARH